MTHLSIYIVSALAGIVIAVLIVFGLTREVSAWAVFVGAGLGLINALTAENYNMQE
jgi:cytochrome c oxidase assembly factor CtaG